MLRKIIALIMTAAMICGAMPAFAAEADSETAQADNAAEENQIIYDENIEKLKAFGFMDSDVSADGEMSRALFVVSLLKVCRYATPPAMSGIMNFIDVRDDMYYAPYISFAMDLGIVNGTDGSSFYPDEAVKLSEAAKMLSSAMGYDREAQSAGGYPNGYLNTAASIGLLDGISLKADDTLTNADAAKMFVNALDADALVLDSSNDSYVKKNLLNIHGIYKAKGVVTAASQISLGGKAELGTDEVQIDFESVYRIGNTQADELIGFFTEYYYKYDSDVSELLYIEKDDRNSELVIEAEDIIDAGNGYIRAQAVGEKTKSYTIKSDAYIMYNGKYITSFSSEMLKPEMGNVRLVSNDGSNSYNVIFVNEYTNIVVGGLNPTEKIAYDMYDSSKSIKFDDQTDIKMHDLLNNELTFSDIAVNDVLSVYLSEDGENAEVILNRQTDKGSIKGKNSEDDSIIIGTVTYRLSPELSNYLISNDKSLNVNDSVTVYIDAFGYIAGYNYSTGEDGEYAYLKKVYSDDNEQKTFVRLFTQGGEHKVLECAESLKLDGTSYKRYNKIYEALINSGLDRGAVVIYKTNAEGKLNYIDTPIIGERESDNTVLKTFSGYRYDEATKTYVQETKLTYKNKVKCFNMQILISDSTPIFVVPASEESRGDDSYYSVKNASSLSNDGQYYIECYQTNPDSIYTDILVQYSNNASNASVEENSNVAVVKAVMQGDDDGEIKTQLQVITGGKEAILIPNDESIFHDIQGYGTYSKKDENGEIYTYSDFTVGDVFRYSKLGNDRVGAVHMIVGTKEKRLGISGGNTKELACQQMSDDGVKYKIARFVIGNVYLKDQGTIRISWENPEDVDSEDVYNLETHLAKNYSVIVVDTKSGRKTDVRTGSVDDILDYKTVGSEYSRVLVHTFWGDPRTIVVFDTNVEF